MGEALQTSTLLHPWQGMARGPKLPGRRLPPPADLDLVTCTDLAPTTFPVETEAPEREPLFSVPFNGVTISSMAVLSPPQPQVQVPYHSVGDARSLGVLLERRILDDISVGARVTGSMGCLPRALVKEVGPAVAGRPSESAAARHGPFPIELIGGLYQS